MGDDETRLNPLAEFIVGMAMGPNPVDKVGKSLKSMKNDAKAITDLPTAISDLNDTLTETNKIMLACIERFG